jgi:hypothetical protein
MAVAELTRTIRSPAPPLAAGDDRPVRSRAVTWSVVAVVFVECLYALWTASRGYFYKDDFIDLQTMRQLGFSGRLFEQPVFGHFIPGFNFVNYLVSLIVPYQWWMVVSIDVFLFGLSLFLLYRLLAILFGSSWLSVPLIALAGASFSLVPSLVWWATALEYLVAIPATLFAVISHVRYLRTGRVRYAVLGAVSIAVGLAFYDGLVVSVLFIALMTVLIWPVAPGLHGAAQTLAAHWRAWVCYAIPVAADLGWRLAHPALYITSSSTTAGQTLDFIALSWTQTFVPLTFGVDAWLLPTHAERVLAGVLGEALLVSSVVITILRRRSAWRAWLLLGATFLGTAALVGFARAGTYGSGEASDVRYVLLDVFFLVIAVGFALLPVRPLTSGTRAVTARADSTSSRSRSSATHRRATARPASFRAVAGFAVLAVVVVYGVGMVVEQNRDPETAGALASHRFFAQFATSWSTVAPPTNRVFLWDTEINPTIVTHAFFPYDTASVTVGPLHPEIRFDAWGGSGYVLRPDGSIVPARAVTQATGMLPTAQGACADPVNRLGKIVVPLDRGLTSTKRWFGLVSYQSATGAVATQSGGATVLFRKGGGTLLTAFPPAPMTSVSWSVPPRSQMCITGFKVVLPEPVGTDVGPTPSS